MAFAFLWRWLQRSPRQRPDLAIVVYTRADCSLCDEAWEMLQRWRKIYGFSLRAEDITGSADLVREHGEWIPVVTVNGRVRFRGRVNEVLLRRMMDAIAD